MTILANSIRQRLNSGLALALLLGLAACGWADANQTPVKSEAELRREQYSTVTGPGGIGSWFSNDRPQEGSSLAVNAFLWRATLDTVSVWPVATADPHGGIVLTDWYAPPATPGERFKLNVYILDRSLRADGVRVAVFRQTRGRDGEWQEAMVQPETASRIEEAILMRARQMRNQAAEGG